MRRRRLLTRLSLLTLAVGVTATCGPSECQVPTLCQISTSYRFAITPDVSPPRAREAILYKIVMRDRESGQPLENGEGQIYASNEAGANTWDSFTKGPELGTYYARLNFVTAETWAMAARFRRDSLHPLEKIEWMQDVHNERSTPAP
jgi:hypothetical protein